MIVMSNRVLQLALIIVLTLSACVNTAPGSVNETILHDDAEQRGIPAPPGPRFRSENNGNVVQQGKVINGIEWSIYNVYRDGAFVNNPEDPGWTYRWNSIRPEFSMAQSTAGLLPSSFFTNYPAGSFWEREKDPSPEGWRVPTQQEVRSLFDTTKVTSEWTTLNGAAGRRFTDRSSGESIFIPAAGRWFADIDSGERTLRKMDIGTGGYYWTATAQGDFGAETFEFNSNTSSINTNHRTMAFMIRPVRNNGVIRNE